MNKINLAVTPCPNDLFMFYRFLTEKDFSENKYNINKEDIESLNQKVFNSIYDVTKLSFNAYFFNKDKYKLLHSGAALGYGCGPMVVSQRKIVNFKEAKVAVPGKFTTAFLLLQLWKPEITNIYFEKFDDIIPKVLSGEYDMGVIIHEGRFVFADFGLVKIQDLGEWWEQETGFPIPLGAIAIKKTFDDSFVKEVESQIRDSILFSQENKEKVIRYIALNSSTKNENIIENHIDSYVNNFSLNLEGVALEAINKLEGMCRCQKII